MPQLRDFKSNDRVRLVCTDDPHTNLRPGDLGTVTIVEDNSFTGPTIHMRWDNGSTLSMLLDSGDVIEPA